MLRTPLRALGRMAATALPLLACAAGAHAQTLAVTSRTTGRVAHIDLATLEVVRMFETGASPHELAAGRRTDDLLGVAVFSPAGGEPLAACPGHRYTEGVRLPILVVRPETEAERPSVKEDLAILARQGHQTWIARPGTHGASMLDPSRAARAEETWRVFDEWLRKVVPP